MTRAREMVPGTSSGGADPAADLLAQFGCGPVQFAASTEPVMSGILSSTASSLPRPRDRANGTPLAVLSGPAAPGARPLSADEQRAHRGGVERARDHELRCSRSALSDDAGQWPRTSLGSVHARVTLLPAFMKTTRVPGPAAPGF